MTTILTDLGRQTLAGVRMLLALTLVVGVGYPLAVWAAGQVFGSRADGSPIRDGDRIVGSRLIGQQFSGPQWFHPRPSANRYDTLASGPSNLGPANPELLEQISERRAEIASREGVAPAEVPPDALTASASGLDPEISPRYAEIQEARVARANGLSLAEVRDLVDRYTRGRTLGFLGEPGVAVVPLNLAVREAARR